MLLIQRYVKLSLIFTIVLLAGCAKQTRVEGEVQEFQFHSYEMRAQRLFLEGEYLQSAALFQRLADKPTTRQNIFRLQAAQALMKAERVTQAKPYLDLVVVAQLNMDQANRFHQLYVQYYVSSGDAEQAMHHLQAISFADLKHEEQQNYYASSALSYALTGKMLDSVQQRIALDAYLNEAAKKENSVIILDSLALVPVQSLKKELSSEQEPIYTGWLEMAVINADSATGSVEFQRAIDAWSQLYPQHPGQALIQDGQFIPNSIVLGNINNIAVFLPQSGPYGNYANTIKEGILAAYRQQEQGELQPNIQFYDTQGVTIASLYQQVVAEGVQLVIGPLDKKLVVELAENAELIVPVLALNYVEGLLKDNLYQFALSPLDEVQQAVRQARAEGHQNAIILTAETAEGKRISTYFQQAWEAVDGIVLEVQSFKHGEKDFSAPVQQALNINESKERYQRVSNVLGKVEYSPRRRQDVDVIFIVADNRVARLINPQFYHNRAKSVAVYGLARLYTGQTYPKKDMDLEGVNFCSIPWLFDQQYQGNLSREALRDIWQSLPAKQWNLVAFGIDAYALLPYLNDLAEVPYDGATGKLLLNDQNRIERHLLCAKFKRGQIELFENQQQ